MNYFIIDQTNPHTGEFDEHKIVTGATIKNAVEAALVYLSNYEPGWQGLGAISESTPHIFDLWLKHGNRKAPFSNSDFAEKPLHLSLVGDAAPDPSKSRHWITIKGSHVLVNGNGEIVAGAAGKLSGRKFNVPAGSKDVSKHIETVEKIAQAGYEKHGGDKAEYLRMGRNKGSSSYFAREYEKKGLDGLPEGHLKEALVDKPADDAVAESNKYDKYLKTTPYGEIFAKATGVKGKGFKTKKGAIEYLKKGIAENKEAIDLNGISNIQNLYFDDFERLGADNFTGQEQRKIGLVLIDKKLEDSSLSLKAREKALELKAKYQHSETPKKPADDDNETNFANIGQDIELKRNTHKPADNAAVNGGQNSKPTLNPALSGLKSLVEEYGANNNLQANKETATLSSSSQNETNNKNEGGSMSVLNFGKHKGKTIEQVAKDDASYISWLYTEPDILNKNLGLEAAIEPYVSEQTKLTRKLVDLKKVVSSGLPYAHPHFKIDMKMSEKNQLKNEMVKKYGKEASDDYEQMMESVSYLLTDVNAFNSQEKNNKILNSVDNFLKTLNSNLKSIPDNSSTKIGEMYVVKFDGYIDVKPEKQDFFDDYKEIKWS